MTFKPDSKWIRRSFLVRQDELDPQLDDFKRRFFTTASIDYTDPLPGGSLCINPVPQRTRFADIRVSNAFTGGDGKGRYIKENFEDNAQIIHMRFGVEQHNSLTQFFTGFYSSDASQVARTGRATNSFFYTLGKVAGFVVQLASWKLLAVHFLGAAVNFLSKTPKSKFYYLKPAMPIYLNAATTIANHLAVNRGIVPRVFNKEVTDKLDPGYTGEAAGPKMAKEFPALFTEKGTVDLYALMNRAKRRERRRMKIIEKKLDQARDLGITDLQKVIRDIVLSHIPADEGSQPKMTDYLDRWFAMSEPKKDAGDKAGANETVGDTFGDGVDNTNKSYLSKVIDFGEAELDDGAAFVSFRVNATGPQQDSFGNTTGESSLGSKMNSMSADARTKLFDFSGGIGGTFGSIVDSVAGAAKSFGEGLLDSVQLSGLAALAGSAFVDIPQYWQSASMNLAKSSYTVVLTSPFHNPISQFLNIDIPISLLLAGVLPKSTGQHSYTGPFLVEMYDRGRSQTRLGVIDSLSINRGIGNVGFNQDGKSLGVEVTFTVKELSSLMHMPITEGFSFTEAAAQAVGKAVGGEKGQAAAVALTGGAFTPDTVFSDYMAVLSGMALNDQIYGFKNLKLNITRKMAAFDTWKSPAHMASFLGDTFPARMIGAFYRGTDKE